MPVKKPAKPALRKQPSKKQNAKTEDGPPITALPFVKDVDDGKNMLGERLMRRDYWAVTPPKTKDENWGTGVDYANQALDHALLFSAPFGFENGQIEIITRTIEGMIEAVIQRRRPLCDIEKGFIRRISSLAVAGYGAEIVHKKGLYPLAQKILGPNDERDKERENCVFDRFHELSR